ncbi:unnamed protein product [Protopolystoma xenopodis]|uniref:Uncharacterized protein n=1 Tax=Protopolystoma xenopodis TaxID=117903 RepID=A0A3S5AL19_9PLAT|nr:unnamed protein product [Protopolystoma xenopodis]
MNVNIDAHSSIAELEESVFRCKHMFLAASDKSESQRQKLMDVLIELRRFLHNAKVGILD